MKYNHITTNSEAQYKRMMEESIPRLVTSLAVPTVIGRFMYFSCINSVFGVFL